MSWLLTIPLTRRTKYHICTFGLRIEQLGKTLAVHTADIRLTEKDGVFTSGNTVKSHRKEDGALLFLGLNDNPLRLRISFQRTAQRQHQVQFQSLFTDIRHELVDKAFRRGFGVQRRTNIGIANLGNIHAVQLLSLLRSEHARCIIINATGTVQIAASFGKGKHKIAQEKILAEHGINAILGNAVQVLSIEHELSGNTFGMNCRGKIDEFVNTDFFHNFDKSIKLFNGHIFHSAHGVISFHMCCAGACLSGTACLYVISNDALAATVLSRDVRAVQYGVHTLRENNVFHMRSRHVMLSGNTGRDNLSGTGKDEAVQRQLHARGRAFHRLAALGTSACLNFPIAHRSHISSLLYLRISGFFRGRHLGNIRSLGKRTGRLPSALGRGLGR
nr:MAG TPA: hypothetical protein [Caudoviricetes sp.]